MNRSELGFLRVAVAFLAIWIAAASVEASLVTATPSGGTVVDFSQYSGYYFTAGPENVSLSPWDPVLYTNNNLSTNSGQGGVLGDGSYGLSSNGTWGGGAHYAGVDSSIATQRFAFISPVSQVGGFMNYAPGLGDLVIRALASDLTTVLEEYVITAVAPISTPNGNNDGAYRGILRPTADIAAFEMTGGFGIVQNLQYDRGDGVVPEPSTLLIWSLLGGLGIAIGWVRRRSLT